MLLTENGTRFEYEGKTFVIGDKVIATKETEYEGLIGTIFEIRDGEDKDTDNDTPDIYCYFDTPIHKEHIQKLEETFSKLHSEKLTIDDIAMDHIIMAPDMIMPIAEIDKAVQTETVYAVFEDWAGNDNYGSSFTLHASLEDAIQKFRIILHDEAEDGIIRDIHNHSCCVEHSSDIYYDCYREGYHCESHYILEIKKVDLRLSASFIGKIGAIKIAASRIEDFIEQLEQWDELEDLSDKMYEKMIADPDVPGRIKNALSKNDAYWESYWESISEVAHRIVREYLEKQAKEGGE